MRPVGLGVVDAPALIVAVASGEGEDLDLVQSLLGGALHDRVHPLPDIRVEVMGEEGLVQGTFLLLLLPDALELLLDFCHMDLVGDALQLIGS